LDFMFEQYFERFTKRVKTVLELARQNAIRYGHSQIETEDVLLALIDEGQGMGVAVLQFLKIDPEHIKFEIEKSIRIGIPLLSSGEIPLSPGVKRVLALSYRQAQYFGHNYVGTEHLLIGLVAEEDGLASKILTRFGLTVENIRKAVETLLWGEPENISKNKQHSQSHVSQVHTKSKTPTIDAYGRDLTQLAEEKKLDPVIGREKEIERVTQILCRRKKNNPVLLGEAGVGKTAIVEGFAQRIASGNIPEILKNKRIIMIDLASLVAGTKYRGEFEQRVKLLLDEIRQNKNIIIFIDELHTLVGAGGAEGAIDASNILKPALSRGEIQCIGATTFDEYRKYIEKDAALERRFQPVIVNPPTVQETIEILRGLRPKYEEHHKLKITDEALVLAAKLADRYIAGRYLPDKAIDLVDEAASKQRLLFSTVPGEIEELEKRALQLASLQEQAAIQQDYEKVARIRDRIREIRSRINELKASREKSIPDSQRQVTGKEIAEIVSKWTGIPLSQLCKEEREKLLEMEEHLHRIVVGQDEAISAVSRAIRRSRAGIKDQRRPIGSFLFLGPTGVGKTLLARALAEFLFGDEQALIQIDMSEYMEKFAISRLIGAPPGYVGYEEGGQLTEKVRRRPYSVVLLDEIEKAHPDVFNLLLQVLEEGRLTDSFGRNVSFQNGILILTSNLGTQHLKNRSTIGFQETSESLPYNVVKEKILEEVKRTFRPEFLNRLDEIIVFHPLDQNHLLKIVDLEVEKVAQRLKEQGFSISLTDSAREFLKNMGTDPQFGARPLRRAISRYLEDPLSEEILRENIPQGAHITVSAGENRLIFTITEGEEHVTTTTDKSPVTPD